MVSVLSLSTVQAAFVLSSKNSKAMVPINSGPDTASFGPKTRDVSPILSEMMTKTDVGLDDQTVGNLQSCMPHEVGPIHFCFIVHGHKGHAQDLWYLHQSIRDKANEHKAFQYVKSSCKCEVGANLDEVASGDSYKDDSATEKFHRRNKRDKFSLAKLKAQPTPQPKNADNNDRLKNSTIESKDSQSKATDCDKNANDMEMLASVSSFIVHNAKCNEGKTDDGIVNGGNRLADEILEVIGHEVEKKKSLASVNDENSMLDSPVDVTISLIGNSLGGLYTRYAIARLAETAEETPLGDDKTTKPGDFYLVSFGKTKIRLHFNVFCTTASPHLGCAEHTYFPIPRIAEKGIAYGLGDTGRDLFRVNTLLYEMATASRFLIPLRRFRKRVAYANAFGTDFVVPTLTAAFLDEESHSLHYFDEYFEETTDEKIADEVKHSIDATATNNNSCPAVELGLVIASFHTRQGDIQPDGSVKDLTIMSSSLDALGWKKVFVDMRREIPFAISLPIGSNSKPSSNCPIQKLKSANKVVESRELAKVLSGNPSKAMISLPLGHNAICAMSRGAVTLAMNGGGIPVVDSLATQLTNDVSSW